MLVAVWDGMDASIPRLQAEEHLSAYNVAVLASAIGDPESRKEILDIWREQAGLIAGTLKKSAEDSMHSAFNRIRKVLGSGHRG